MATLKQLEKIKKLNTLKQKGVLNEQEFLAAKAEILATDDEKKCFAKKGGRAEEEKALLNVHIMVAIIVFLAILGLIVVSIVVSKINAFEAKLLSF